MSKFISFILLTLSLVSCTLQEIELALADATESGGIINLSCNVSTYTEPILPIFTSISSTFDPGTGNTTNLSSIDNAVASSGVSGSCILVRTTIDCPFCRIRPLYDIKYIGKKSNSVASDSCTLNDGSIISFNTGTGRAPTCSVTTLRDLRI